MSFNNGDHDDDEYDDKGADYSQDMNGNGDYSNYDDPEADGNYNDDDNEYNNNINEDEDEYYSDNNEDNNRQYSAGNRKFEFDDDGDDDDDDVVSDEEIDHANEYNTKGLISATDLSNSVAHSKPTFNAASAGVSWSGPDAKDEDEDEDNDDDEALQSDDEQGNDISQFLKADDNQIPDDDVAAAIAERDALRQVHQARQQDILSLWALASPSKRQQLVQLTEARAGTLHNVDYLQHQYAKSLDLLSALWDQVSQRKSQAEARTRALTAILDKRDERLTKINNTFKVYRREIAREARHSRTDKSISPQVLFALEDSEETLETQLAEARLKYVHTKHQVRRLETLAKRKDELSQGLHLVDLEQLKIEMATLSDQLEERSDQLHKLRKKITSTVQILTHVKEKLHFVRLKNTDLEHTLEDHTASVSSIRDKLTRTKHARDTLRKQNAIMKQKQGFIGSDMLVGDFEGRKDDLVKAAEKLQNLKNQHQQLTSFVASANKEAATISQALKMGR